MKREFPRMHKILRRNFICTSCWFLRRGRSPMYLMMQAKHSRAILFRSGGSKRRREFCKNVK